MRLIFKSSAASELAVQKQQRNNMYKRLLIISVLALTLTLISTSKASNSYKKIVKIEYDGKIEIKTLHAPLRYVLNRKYFLKKIPSKLLFLKITVMQGGVHKPIKAKIPANTILYIFLDSGRKLKENDVDEYVRYLRREGWRSTSSITASDKRMKYLRVYIKKFHKETTEEFPGVGFPGVMVGTKYMELEKK